MEVTSKRRITVDIRKNNKVAIPSFVQGDTNVVEFEILDNGVAADLSTVGKVVANYKRPDKHVVTREATYAGNIVSYRMGQEEMEVAGLGEVEVQFFNADYSKRLSTFAVRINVAQSVGEAAELSDELGNTLLQDLLVKGDYAEEQAKQAEAAAKTALTNWLSPVANKAAVDAIAGPKLGDTVQTNDNGFVYRYDGTKWVKTQEYGATALANVNAQLADTAKKTDIEDIVSIRSMGIKGIGDETTAFFNAVNTLASQNKMILIPQDMTITISNCTISGKNNFGILCYGKLKRVDNSNANSLLELSGCSDVNIPFLNTDGNVSKNGNSVKEIQHSLRIGNGCNKINIGVLNDSNPSGDTLYINNGDNITIDSVRSISDIATGRNAVSIIKGKNIVINKVLSLNTGHPTMPGGIDLETNLVTDTISNVKINYAIITTYGVSGFQIANPSAALITNIEMNGFVTKINSPTYQYAFALSNVDGFKGNIKCRQTGTSTCDAVLLNNCNNIDLYIDSENSARGFLLTGYVTDFHIKGKLKSTQVSGINLAGTNYKGIFDMTIKDVGKSGSGSVVYVAPGNNASNIIFRGDFSKATHGHSCFRIEGTASNLRAENLDMSGWPDSYIVYGANAGGSLFGVNCPNYNYRSAVPSGIDGYSKGMIIWNTSPTAGGKLGWSVTSSGKPGTIKPFGVIDV